MATLYTTPATHVAGYVVDHDDWNELVNDIKESAPAKAATAGYFIRVVGANEVEEADPGDGSKLDGDHVDIDFTPTNYTPSTTPAEAADVDDLAAHLAGIDNAIPAIGARAWGHITAAGILDSPSFNVSSVTDSGTGNRTIIWDTDFSTAIYSVVLGPETSPSLNHISSDGLESYAVGSVVLKHYAGTGGTTLTDRACSFGAWGNQ